MPDLEFISEERSGMSFKAVFAGSEGQDRSSEFVQLLELLADYTGRRDRNSRLTPTARLEDENSNMELLHQNCLVCRPGRGLP